MNTQNQVNDKDDCLICNDEEADHIANCGHKLCKPCWDRTIKAIKCCPFCQQPIRDAATIKSLKAIMPIIYVVMADPQTDKRFPRYFTDLTAATEFARVIGEESNKTTWIDKIVLPDSVPQDGFAGTFVIGEDDYEDHS